MITLITVIPPLLIFIYRNEIVKTANTYVGGRNFRPTYHFEASGGAQKEMTIRNYYLDEYFSEKSIVLAGNITCLLALLCMFGVGIL